MIDCAEAKKQKDLVFTLSGKEFRIPAEKYILDVSFLEEFLGIFGI
jgi:hypothetical protein